MKKRQRKQCDPIQYLTEEYTSADLPEETTNESVNNYLDCESSTTNLENNPDIQTFRILKTSTAAAPAQEGGHHFTGCVKEEEQQQQLRSQISRTMSANMSSQKNILMCFICKLSFGEPKSFISHALDEHKIKELNMKLMEYCKTEADQIQHDTILSAIIQKDNQDQPTICFLEPLKKGGLLPENNNSQANVDDSSIPSDNDKVEPAPATTIEDPICTFLKAITKQIYKDATKQEADIERDPSPANHRAAAAEENEVVKYNDKCNMESSSNEKLDLEVLRKKNESLEEVISTLANSSNFLSLFQKITPKFIDGNEAETTASVCSEHNNNNNNNSNNNNNQLSPVESNNCSPINTPKSPSYIKAGSAPSPPNNSFTIGVCPEHINGRKLGYECSKCELILNSTRIQSSSNISSTRNSCKTLKCPQCNWHYKYQETLEIHMREKHPDGESACAYCIAGQPHPRLARGETYTCGYKPYRCEICNYSTTTKGNLSIHMQSDKHLNNMQEITNQQIADIDPAPQNFSFAKSPPHQNDQSNNLYQPGRPNAVAPKTNFRCDICSYETSVARNLRIHMTSEKHTNNISILEQNIKKIQMMGKLHSQHKDVHQPPQPPQQMHPLPFYPEKAIADISYNQALLIQFLQNTNYFSSENQQMQQEDSISKQDNDIKPVIIAEESLSSQIVNQSTLDDNNNSEKNEDDENVDMEKGSNDNFDCTADRYFDPQRPFKCEQCHESFTQKNILLVHFNSVSHLNRMKKLGEASLEENVNNLKRKLNDTEVESQKKRFKCDICKVAYAQGSTLDIHMRSVLHQTRACRMTQENVPNMQQQQPQQAQQQTPVENENEANKDLPKHFNQQLYKLLLEKFGFDIVKQFNESDITAENFSTNRQITDFSIKSGFGTNNDQPMNYNVKNKTVSEVEECYRCQQCSRQFSTISSLKLHMEEKHNPNIKLERPEITPDIFKNNYAKNAAFMAKQAFPQSDQIIDYSSKSPPFNAINDTPEEQPEKKPEKLPPQVENEMEKLNNVGNHFMDKMPFGQLPLLPEYGANNLHFSGLPQIDLLNIIQFHHHMMGLNFMNLAPPLNSSSSVNMNLPSLITKINNSDTNHSPSSISKQLGGPNVSAGSNQKRARTRITDEQLKILRAHFDINNSPSEESIIEMSKMANLPTKVVKHWFRNTLFKERQRNKDSPYNFSNPPSTTLNLEEYERTGNAKVVSLEENNFAKKSISTPEEIKDCNMVMENFNKMNDFEQKPALISPQSVASSYKSEVPNTQELKDAETNNIFAMVAALNVGLTNSPKNKSESCIQNLSKSQQIPQMGYNFGDCKSECESMNSSISEQINSLENESQPQSPSERWMQGNSPSPSSESLNNFKKSKENSMGMSNNSMMNNSNSNGKRANRTRFTDYQIKVLQEFFENNSYPKDSDLEYLSKLLLLSPRVIVVWFQNARQKQRKIYENQPNSVSMSPSSQPSLANIVSPGSMGMMSRNTPNQSPSSTDEEKVCLTNNSNICYTCKKCSLVFQRYYELIRHQKNHCFKEENNKKSAKAQIAAAQIAQQCLSKSGIDTTADRNSKSTFPKMNFREDQPNMAGMMTSGTYPTGDTQNNKSNDSISLRVESRSMNMDNFLPIHNEKTGLQGLNIVPKNENLSSVDTRQYNEINLSKCHDGDSNEIGLVDNFEDDVAKIQNNIQQHTTSSDGPFFDDEHPKKCSNFNLPKIKFQTHLGSSTRLDDRMFGGAQSSTKRLRTTISPDQLQFLFECYQQESNPSRKMLEEIAKKVNLKKRVVQVWYQNSRARERKGHFRISSIGQLHQGYKVNIADEIEQKASSIDDNSQSNFFDCEKYQNDAILVKPERQMNSH